MRNTIIIILGIGVVILVGAFFVFNSSNGSSPAAVHGYATDVYFKVIAQGEQSRVVGRKNYIINSASDLTVMWRMIDASGQPPTIDFESDNVIAVFAGKQSTGGHDIQVTQIQDSVSRKLTIKLTNPGGSCLVAQGETSPYQLIQLPKTALTYTREDVTDTMSCLR